MHCIKKSNPSYTMGFKVIVVSTKGMQSCKMVTRSVDEDLEKGSRGLRSLIVVRGYVRTRGR